MVNIIIGGIFAEEYLTKNNIPFKIVGTNSEGNPIFDFTHKQTYEQAHKLLTSKHAIAEFDGYQCPACKSYNVKEVIEIPGINDYAKMLYQCNKCKEVFT